MNSCRLSTVCVAITLFLTGCAGSPSSVQAHYISDVQFKSYSCDEVEEEMARVAARVTEVSHRQSNAAAADAVSMTVGLVIFWPALFALAATDDHAAELGRLKGEYEALERVARKRRCNIEAPLTPKIEDPQVDRHAIQPNT